MRQTSRNQFLVRAAIRLERPARDLRRAPGKVFAISARVRFSDFVVKARVEFLAARRGAQVGAVPFGAAAVPGEKQAVEAVELVSRVSSGPDLSLITDSEHLANGKLRKSIADLGSPVSILTAVR
ncbi:hypothetical protein [Nocardia abscessus]|uniref:Uncharacterized protein n=1 Tax=Nocardia abscessus TaxID=120957 RepID=A0ABS0C729_9NOCA|nr:hypothetical protein [Nocardia abscessus]MBF6226182.1 hypothetical protein [Nocardia abscessus]